MNDNASLSKLYSNIINLHSFSYKSLSEAKKEILIDKYKYCFDALSLCTYHHNLKPLEYQKLGRMLDEYYMHADPETKKERLERAVLFHFVQLSERDLRSYNISKTKRPDFILKGTQTIGVEVVKLTDEYESILEKIVSDSACEIEASIVKEKAIKKHGSKAEKYEYRNIQDRIAVGTGVLDLNEKKKGFVIQIIRKIEKYRNMFNSFDEFIVLCDAQSGIGITNKSEIDEIIECVKNYFSDKMLILIAVLWCNKFGKLMLNIYNV